MMYRFEADAPAAIRDTLGIDRVRLGGGVVLAMRHDPVNYWNKALGFGFAQPVTADLIGEICDFYRSRQVPSAVLQLAPSVLPADWGDICAAYGLSRASTWVKLGRELSEPPAPSGPRVERITTPEAAEEWASVLVGTFGWSDRPLMEMSAALALRPDVHAFAVRADGRIVSVAGLKVNGETGHLFGGATLEAYRGRGGQSALLRARIAAAAEAGCRAVFAETGAEGPGEHNTSLHNMRRAGLVPLYERVNWRWNAA